MSGNTFAWAHKTTHSKVEPYPSSSTWVCKIMKDQKCVLACNTVTFKIKLDYLHAKKILQYKMALTQQYNFKIMKHSKICVKFEE